MATGSLRFSMPRRTDRCHDDDGPTIGRLRSEWSRRACEPTRAALSPDLNPAYDGAEPWIWACEARQQ